jgi:hypothetical protein
MAKGDNIKEFGKLLTKKIQGHVMVQTCWVTVQAVDWDAKTMTAVGLLDGLPYYNVLLGNGSHYRRPAVNTDCLIGIIQNQEAASFLIDAEQVEEFNWISGDSTCTINESGFILKQGNESFKQLLNDIETQVGKLCDELIKVKVTIGQGPNIVAIQAIKEKITGDIKTRTNQIFTA